MSAKNELDQYYTSEHVANLCWKRIEEFLRSQGCNLSDYKYIEPSAGTGAFLRDDLNISAYDLEPKDNRIHKADFLEVNECIKDKIVVGNPPFGFASNLALKFINHCASNDAKYICFILPKTFAKKVFQEKLDKRLHLRYQEHLPKKSFILDGNPYDVPCVFQIWELKEQFRNELIIKPHLTLGSETDYDFILRRVGGRAGKIISADAYTKSSSLYVKGDRNLVIKYAEEISKECVLTAGVKSITLKEINYIITSKEGE